MSVRNDEEPQGLVEVEGMDGAGQRAQLCLLTAPSTLPILCASQMSEI